MKILTKTFYAFTILLLLSVAGLFLASMLPIPGNIEIKIVKSGSMEPTIPIGSLVVIKPVDTYQRGDVITFGEDTRSQIPTTHRIIATREENGTWYTTKGDANEDPDTKEIRKADIIGTVITHVPYAGYVLDFAKKPLGFLLLIGIPAAAIIIDELINIFREVRAAWRRRNRGDGSHSGGSSFDEDTETHVVFARRFSMDDIYVPLRVFKVRATRRLVSQRQYVNASASVLAVFVVISLSTGGTESTLSYFRDTESSAQNIFGAGEWSIPAQPLINNARFFSATAMDGEVLGADTSLDDPVPPPDSLESDSLVSDSIESESLDSDSFDSESFDLIKSPNDSSGDPASRRRLAADEPPADEPGEQAQTENDTLADPPIESTPLVEVLPPSPPEELPPPAEELLPPPPEQLLPSPQEPAPPAPVE